MPRPIYETVAVTAPRPGDNVGLGESFSWEGIAGSVAYRVEIHPLDGAIPDAPGTIPEVQLPTGARGYLTGVIVPADQTSVAMARFAFDRLETGRTYRWRVVAIGPRGVVLGRSEPLLQHYHRDIAEAIAMPLPSGAEN